MGQIKEPVLLEGFYPFRVIYDRRIDAAIAFGGAGGALIGGVAHGALGDMVTDFVDGRAVHMQGNEDAVVDELRVGFF